jgi:hypothetical protein
MDYNELMKERYAKYANSGDFNLGGEQPDEEAPAAPVAPPAKEMTATEKGSGAAMKTAAAGGGAMDILQQGLMASGHPGGMAAGLGLSAANAIVQGRNQRAQDAYQAEIKKINERQDAINRMAMIGQGLKA